VIKFFPKNCTQAKFLEIQFWVAHKLKNVVTIVELMQARQALICYTDPIHEFRIERSYKKVGHNCFDVD
jgi:hypothetical protein